MPHPKKILEGCKQKLEKDYPSSDYVYKFEQKIPGGFYPDIQIEKDGKLVCVCEIGYTEAEKIKAYKKMKIPEVRWYTRDLELVIQTGEFDKAPIELRKDALKRIKEQEEKCKGRIESEIQSKIGTLRMIEFSKLEKTIRDGIEKKVSERQARVNELLNHNFYLLPLEWTCWYCDDEKCKGKIKKEDIEEFEGTEYLYFNDQEYQCFYECEFNQKHNTDEGPFTWDDDCGPHEGEYKELLEIYLRTHLEIDKKDKK